LHIFDWACNFIHDKSMTKSLFNSGFAEDCPNVSADSLRIALLFKSGFAEDFRTCNSSDRHISDMTPLNIRLPGLPKLLSQLYGESKEQLKLVVALRNPIHRFHSGYYQARADKCLPVESFGAYVQMLRKSWPDIQNSGNLSRAYKADQLYRSMYGVALQPWLQIFPPSQFAIIPMDHYFTNLEIRVSTINQLGKHFDIGLNGDQLDNLTHAKSRKHPSLEDDLDKESREWLDKEVFGPDIHLLATSLASGLKAGMLFPGYAASHSANEIVKFLNWGALTK